MGVLKGVLLKGWEIIRWSTVPKEKVRFSMLLKLNCISAHIIEILLLSWFSQFLSLATLVLEIVVRECYILMPTSMIFL